MSMDTHCHSEFEGERGYFTDFAVVEIVEKGGYFVNNLRKIINKGSYPDPHWNFKAQVFIISLYNWVHIDLK